MEKIKKALVQVTECLFENNDVHSALKVLEPKLVVKVTRRGKPSSKFEVVVTIGRPNYEAKKFIASCQKAGEPFPVKRIQLKFYPKRKK